MSTTGPGSQARRSEPGHVSLETLRLEERDGRTVVHTHSVNQSVEARNAMVESGIEAGMDDEFNRLDELVARLRAPVA